MKKTVLITGASGFIGSQLSKYFKGFKSVGLTRQENLFKERNLVKCDLTNQVQLKKIVKDINPDVVYHFAALTNPQRNEQTPEDARLLHVGITKNLINAINTQHTHIVFLSTDKVFDGIEIAPDETSETNPIWGYGSLKLECEKIIEENMPKYHIIRLPIVHGNGNEKSSSFIDDALINLRRGNKVYAFNNIKRCFVKLDELTGLLKKLIDNSHYGIYHGGSTLTSYYERILMLCNEDNIVVNGRLVPVEGNVKPSIQNLNTRKLEKIFNFTFS